MTLGRTVKKEYMAKGTSRAVAIPVLKVVNFFEFLKAGWRRLATRRLKTLTIKCRITYNIPTPEVPEAAKGKS